MTGGALRRNADNTGGVWFIGTLPGREDHRLAFDLDTPEGNRFSGWVHVTAAASSKHIEEPASLRQNNTSTWYGTDNGKRAASVYHTNIAVDDRELPGEGEDKVYEFKVRAINSSSFAGGAPLGYVWNTLDARVEVEASPGLAIIPQDEDQGADPKSETATTGSYDPATGVWSVGTLTHWSATAVDPHVLTLKAKYVPGQGPACLTAVITAFGPEPIGYSDDNNSTFCLGEEPLTLLHLTPRFGEPTQMLALYPCVGVASYPCNDQDAVELVVIGGGAARHSGVNRADTTPSYSPLDWGEPILRPEKVIFQIREPGGRTVDESGNVVWETDDSGLELRFNNERMPISDWSSLSATMSVPSGSAFPKGSTFSMRPVVNPSVVFLDPVTTVAVGPISHFLADVEYFFRVDVLGTYRVEIGYPYTHASLDSDGDGDNDVFSASGVYTFHAGPIAELTVRDGAPNPSLPKGQRGFSIMAVNNGPDASGAVKVTVTGLPPSGGVTRSVTRGSFDPDTGVWSIDELRPKGLMQAVEGRDGELLTIVTNAAANATTTAAITNTQDYQVCIGSDGDDLDHHNQADCEAETGASWHTAEYLDDISDNNSVIIMAREGTGADLPVEREARAATSVVIVSWEPIAEVNGRRVTHYEVQRRTNPWTTVTINVTDVSEVGSVSITPAGQPQVGVSLTAVLTHDGGEPADPRWQWQRTNADGIWSDIEGAESWEYTPTERDAGRRLQATVVYIEPDDGGESVVGAVTEAVTGEPLAYFASTQYTHSVAENSAPGTPVGPPLTVVSGSASGVAYTLEGPDAALFDIGADSGQISVGAATVLDFESGRTAYSVEVVAQPETGVGSRATVTINVLDVAEAGFPLMWGAILVAAGAAVGVAGIAVFALTRRRMMS